MRLKHWPCEERWRSRACSAWRKSQLLEDWTEAFQYLWTGPQEDKARMFAALHGSRMKRNKYLSLMILALECMLLQETWKELILRFYWMGEKPLHSCKICHAFQSAVLKGLLKEVPQADYVPRMKEYFMDLENAFFPSFPPNLQCIKFVSRWGCDPQLLHVSHSGKNYQFVVQ